MNNKKIGTFDIETNALLENVTKVHCCVIKDHSTGAICIWDSGVYADLCRLLDTYDVLIGHNCIAFDFPALRKVCGYEYSGSKVDTLIMSRTQRPNRQAPPHCEAGPNSVEAWGLRLGHKKVANEEWNTYHPLMLKRCKEDVEIQYKIYQSLLEEGKGEGWGKAHRLNNKLFDLLQRQEEYGWPVDKVRLDRNLSILNSWINRIDRSVSGYLPLITEPLETKKAGEYSYVKKPFLKNGELADATQKHYGDIDRSLICGPYCRVAFRPVDLDSNNEVKEFLLKQGWQPAEWNENDAGEKTSAKLSKDDPFTGIQGSLGRLIAKRVQCKQRIGILEGWRNSIRSDGRISGGVGGIATTGRLRHKGIVNVPSPHSGAFFAKQMRMVFTCRPDWVLVGVDSKGNQVRQLAARMDDPEFTKAVLKDKERDGEDFHSYNQTLCGGISRSRAKNFFYGFIFGAKAPKIAQQISDIVLVAQGLIDTYLKQLPKLKLLIDKLTSEWKATASKKWGRPYNGYIRGVDGRPIQVDMEHKVLCFQLQSDEAIQMGAAYVKFHHEMAKHGYVLGHDWGMLIWMHDEFQFECKPELTEAAAKIGCDAISWAGKFYGIKCPHEGDYKVGRNWSETH